MQIVRTYFLSRVKKLSLQHICRTKPTSYIMLIALLPILTSTGRGSDIMIPMAIPTFGGMLIQSMTIFVVPVLQSMWRENVIKKGKKINE